MLNMVSIIIPCRNEEKFIGKCLESVLAQDYSDKEIIVIDGMSKDRTVEIANKYPVWILPNENIHTPFGLNMGIKQAKGDIIIRMDSHAEYPKDYISKCVKHLQESGADNVGGNMITLPSGNTKTAKAIAKVMSGLGAGSSFRRGEKEPKEVDTVWGGCYRKEVFERIGLFNENLKYSQDMEFNLRLKRSGGKIMLFPDIVSYYFPKGTLWEFIKHNFNDGIWATYPLKFGIKLKFRHYVPLFLCFGFALFILWLGFILRFN